MVGRETAPPAPNPDVDSVSQQTNPDPASTAPAPTHIFRIENGVNWNERSEGN